MEAIWRYAYQEKGEVKIEAFNVAGPLMGSVAGEENPKLTWWELEYALLAVVDFMESEKGGGYGWGTVGIWNGENHVGILRITV